MAYYAHAGRVEYGVDISCNACGWKSAGLGGSDKALHLDSGLRLARCLWCFHGMIYDGRKLRNLTISEADEISKLPLFLESMRGREKMLHAAGLWG